MPTETGVTIERIGGLAAAFDDPDNQFRQMLGMVFRQKNYTALARKRVNIGRVSQSTGANAALDYFTEVLLMEGNLALGHLHHSGAIGVAAGYRSSEIGQTG